MIVSYVHIYVKPPKVKNHLYEENHFCWVSSRWLSKGGGGTIGTLIQLPRNAQCDFFQTHARRCGVVIMSKSRNGSVRIFFVCVRKLMLGSTGTLLDNLGSVHKYLGGGAGKLGGRVKKVLKLQKGGSKKFQTLKEGGSKKFEHA